MTAAARNRLTVRLAETWGDFEAAAVSRIPFDAPAKNRDVLESLVRSGKAKLCEIVRDSEVVGMLCYSIETHAAREFVIEAIFCEGQNDVCAGDAWVNEFCERLARGLGCVSMRFHTLRPGMVKNAISKGWRASEIIMQKNL